MSKPNHSHHLFFGSNLYLASTFNPLNRIRQQSQIYTTATEKDCEGIFWGKQRKRLPEKISRDEESSIELDDMKGLNEIQ